MTLADLERRFSELRRPPTPAAADQALGLVACEEALRAARCGSYGVGAVLVDPAGEIVERGGNQVFAPRFRSDLHAEMVVLNKFEDRSPRDDMRGFTLLSSVEPCLMCCGRLLIAGVEIVKFLAPDEWGGMTSRLDGLPPAWERLHARQSYLCADVSDDLRQLASDAFQLNLDALRRRLWSR